MVLSYLESNTSEDFQKGNIKILRVDNILSKTFEPQNLVDSWFVRFILTVVCQTKVTFESGFDPRLIKPLFKEGGPLVPFEELRGTLLKKFSWIFGEALQITKSQVEYSDYMSNLSIKNQKDISKVVISPSKTPEFGDIAWSGYDSLAVLYLIQHHIIEDKTQFVLMEPWYFVKLTLVHLVDLDPLFYSSINYFRPLVEFFTTFIDKKCPRLSNPGTLNCRMLEITNCLRSYTVNLEEIPAKAVSSLF